MEIFDNCQEHLRIILFANHLAARHLNLAYMKKNTSCNSYDIEEYCYSLQFLIFYIFLVSLIATKNLYFIARNFPYFTRARQFCWCDYHKKSADFMTEHYNAVKLGLWSCCSPLQWWVSSLQRWGMIAFIDYMIYGYCTRISRMLMKGTPTAYCR